MILPSETHDWRNRCIRLDQVDSTNAHLINMLKSEDVLEGTSVVTDFQLDGRGQRGKGWSAQQGKSLCFSIVLYPDFIAPNGQFTLNMMISVALLKALKTYVEDLSIKWPNDIYYGEQKLAGILIQNIIAAEKIDNSVVGIGVNVNETSFPDDLPNPVSLNNILDVDLEIEQVHQRIVAEIQILYDHLKMVDFQLIQNFYLDHLFGLNVEREYVVGEIKHIGSIAGISAQGKLQVFMGQDIKEFQFGDIEYVFE